MFSIEKKKSYSFWCRYPKQAVQYMGRFSLPPDFPISTGKFTIQNHYLLSAVKRKKKLDWKIPVKQWLEISSLKLILDNVVSKHSDWKCINNTQSMLDRKFPINGIVCTVKKPKHEKRKPALLKIEEVCGENQMNFIRDLTPLWMLKSATAFKNFGKCCTFMTT